jgi:DnaJ-class molecular chaperone
MFRNLYDILDLPDFYDDEKEVDRLYGILGSRWHPRRNVNMYDYAEQRFKDISKAYSILANKEKKKRYDKLLREAPHEDHFNDVLAPFHEDRGLEFYDNNFQNFLEKRNSYCATEMWS